MTTATKARLPRAVDAERYCIGCLVRFPERAPQVLESGLRAADFVDPLHQQVFTLCLEQQRRGCIDPRLIGKQTDPGYLMHLADDVNTTVHVPAEAAKIIDARRKRQLFEIADSARYEAQNGHTAEDVFNRLSADLEVYSRDAQASTSIDTFEFGDLCSQYPRLKPVLIDGFARLGEVINIISNPKVGKSWFSYCLALSVITGRPLFGRFATTPARVLIVDNELHRETLSHRIPLVADAMGIDCSEYMRDLIIRSLRGQPRSFFEVADDLERIEPQTYGLIIFDAKYRFAVAGQSENDNASEALFYNRADQLAIKSGAAIAFVHHASKGSQSEKRISDVGSGAGAQSRAADVHAVFREHEDDGTFVFEALVRSFAPVAPIGLRWHFPLWVPDEGIDAAKLKGRVTKSDEQQAIRDREGTSVIIDVLRKGGPATMKALRRSAIAGQPRLERLLFKLESEGHITSKEATINGNKTHEYSLVEDTE